MKLEVISMDGLGLAAEAWRLSRDVDAKIEWREIFTLDCPVTEMASAVLHFKDFTVLEREVVASNRLHVMWARSFFVDDPYQYRIPKEINHLVDGARHVAMRSVMHDGRKAGLHQDEWRVHLPAMAETRFVSRVSFRDLVKLAKYFMKIATLRDDAVGVRWGAVAEELRRVCDLFTGSRDLTDQAWRSYSTPKYLHEEATTKFKAELQGSVWVMGIEVPLWLRAHFARHRPLTFIDDVFRKFVVAEDVTNMTIGDPVVMELAASRDYWRSLLSRRSCWMTQSTLSVGKDPWARIIDQFGDAESLLPCSDGVCPYEKDARLRYEGTHDPGAPCPRWLWLHDIERTPRIVAMIDQALPSRAEFWRRQ